ncbi:hypothetical protein IFM89_009273 [Coptis chinensis]|uniref:Pentatricopeptide repeat-containing protein n=1 Tax=Coptis chinensis TaxID=261450 RepID=A0A835I3B1_9MAGN|nr:hypothetical protein IFM89_009273 [Coptis chinensis]
MQNHETSILVERIQAQNFDRLDYPTPAKKLSRNQRLGYGEEALKLLKQREVRYQAKQCHLCRVLSVCSHVGFVEEEAENFISQMLFDPDIVVFKTLLAACRNYGDVEVAKRAADSVWKLDPSDSASHVLLGNILASTGNWGEVARVRRLMRSRGGVRKVPGQSWIEVSNYKDMSVTILNPKLATHGGQPSFEEDMSRSSKCAYREGYPSFQNERVTTKMLSMSSGCLRKHLEANEYL